MSFIELQNFLIAIAVGGLIGLEREIGMKSKDRSSFAGFRTFILISFFGAISYFMGDKLDLPYLPAIGFTIFSLLVIVTYYVSAKKGYIGITSELTSIVTYLLGVLVMQAEYQEYAIIFAVLITILLAFKKYVRKLVQRTKIQEWYDTLKFAFIAFVILPLLPNQGFGPYDFFNPYKTWLMVVFVSGLSFIGYFAIKFFGARIGTNLSGLLGGLVSSTAVTTTMANRSKEVKESQHFPFVTAAILASTIMFIRVLVEAYTLNQSLVYDLLVPLLAMFVVGLVPVLIWWKKSEEKEEVSLDLKSPFSLPPALQFAAFFLIIQLLTKAVIARGFDQMGLLVTSVVAGTTDVDAITLSMSNLAREGSITNQLATLSIMAAVITNTIVKGSIAWAWGGKRFRNKFVGVVALMIIIGIGVIAIS